MSQAISRKTSLFEEHRKLGAKMVDFGGWLMPVSYTSVLAEHQCVRERCGLFDVSHMGEFTVEGADALAFIQMLTVNDAARLGIGQGQYSALCYEHGGMVDDLIVYRTGEDSYFLCVNASNIAKDYAWLAEHAPAFPRLKLANVSEAWSQLAIQGPQSLAALDGLLTATDRSRLAELAYTHIMDLTIGGMPAKLARTGYTGEKGFELYLPGELAADVWQRLLNTAPTSGLQAIGLGARDTLRLEACYLLYGSDMDETVSPLEAGIAWAVKLTKAPFIGRQALVVQKEQKKQRRIFAFRMEEQGIPRHGMPVLHAGKPIGFVTSGSVLPTLGGAGGMALLAAEGLAVGTRVAIDVRGKTKQARLAERPLYKAKVKD